MKKEKINQAKLFIWHPSFNGILFLVLLGVGDLDDRKKVCYIRNPKPDTNPKPICFSIFWNMPVALTHC